MKDNHKHKWTTLKGMSDKYCPIKYINGKLIYSTFRWCLHLNFFFF